MILANPRWAAGEAWKGPMSHDVTCHPLGKLGQPRPPLQDNTNREGERSIAALSVEETLRRRRHMGRYEAQAGGRPVISPRDTRRENEFKKGRAP
jgi:hypothetical protein